MNEKIALYPGTFDPMTMGHLDIVSRCAKVFDRIIVGIARNPQKKPLFNIEEREQIIREATATIANVDVQHFDGLTVDHAKKNGASYLVRGLRAVTDFEYELQMAMINRHLNPDVETFFIVPDERYSFISSSQVKSAYLLGGAIDDFLPESALKMLRKKVKPDPKNGNDSIL